MNIKKRNASLILTCSFRVPDRFLYSSIVGLVGVLPQAMPHSPKAAFIATTRSGIRTSPPERKAHTGTDSMDIILFILSILSA